MAGAVANLMVRAGADFSQLQSAMERTQSQVSGFQARMESAFGKVEKVLAMVGIGIGVGEVVHQLNEATQSAMELEATTQNLNHMMGQSTDSFLEWAKTTAASYGMSELEADKYGKSFAHMISLFSTSTDDLKNKTEEMLKVATIVANGTGRTMEDVMMRIQSGMLGNVQAINDLGIYANESMITSTKAFQQFANGKHWADLSMATKQQIMYYAILEQASQQYGNTLNQNVHLKMVQFTATLKNVQTALGNAFLPILNRVLPLLTAMANRILQVMTIVGEFTQALFGKSVMGTAAEGTNAQTKAINDQAGAVGGLANAHEKLTKAKGGSSSSKSTGSTMGFDEVHTLADKSGADGSSGAGGGAGGTGTGGIASGISDIGQASQNAGEKVGGISQKIQDFANKVKSFFAPIGNFFMKIWDVIADYFQEKVRQISDFWSKHGQNFIIAIQKIWAFLQPIIMFIAKFIWDSIKGAIDGIIRFFEGLIEFIGGIFTGHWKEAFQGLWDMIVGFIQAAWNIFNLVFIVEIGGALKGLVVGGGKLFGELFTLFKKPMSELVSWAIDAFKGVVKSISKMFSDFGNWWDNLVFNLGLKFFEWGTKLKNVASESWSFIKSVFGGAYDWFMRTLVNPIVNAFDKIKDGFSKGFGNGIKALVNSFIDVINSAIGNLNGIIHMIPGTGSLSIPKIPHLAKGGITNGPTLALIGDNPGGQEVVSPLDKLSGIVTNAVLTAMQFSKPSTGGISGDVILNIDGKQFARIIKPYADLENKRVGTNVRLQSI